MAYDNPIIAKRFKEKMARLDKTANSIDISWAINNCSATLNEKEKEKPWKERFALICKRYQDFIDEKRGWMMDNMPQEPIDPTTPEGEQVAMDLVDPKDDEEVRYEKVKD